MSERFLIEVLKRVGIGEYFGEMRAICYAIPLCMRTRPEARQRPAVYALLSNEI